MLSAGSLFTIFFFGNIELSDDFMVGTRYVTLFAVILMAIIVCVEVSSMIFNKKGATRNTLNAAIFMLGFISSSRDAINGLSYFFTLENNGPIMTFLFDLPHSVVYFGAVFYILKFYCNNYEIDTSFFTKMGFFLLMVVAFVDNILVIFHLQFISALIIMHFALLIYFTFFVISYRKKKVDTVFVLSGLIFFALTGSYIASTTGAMFDNYPYGLESWAMIVVFAIFLMIYAVYLIKMFKKNYSTIEYEEKLKELQSTILMEQINPHFIFNSLVLIKSIYIRDRKQGDRAIDLLSKHIRANVDVKGGKLLIPIEEELKNVQCFIELANMQNTEPLNVIFNIDAYDFTVPILSIEPFIENAIKYSGIQSKKDGYIELSTEETDSMYIIKISDNGKGFNKKEYQKKSSHGIKNALLRFEFLLKAKTDVISKPNEGTSIEIYIPKQKEQKEGK